MLVTWMSTVTFPLEIGKRMYSKFILYPNLIFYWPSYYTIGLPMISWRQNIAHWSKKILFCSLYFPNPSAMSTMQYKVSCWCLFIFPPPFKFGFIFWKGRWSKDVLFEKDKGGKWCVKRRGQKEHIKQSSKNKLKFIYRQYIQWNISKHY